MPQPIPESLFLAEPTPVALAVGIISGGLSLFLDLLDLPAVYRHAAGYVIK